MRGGDRVKAFLAEDSWQTTLVHIEEIRRNATDILF
jgi:hypothetical protein